MAEEIEKIYVIPLKKKGFKSSVAAPIAVKRVKQFLTKHMKVEAEDIWMDDSLNNALWTHGKYRMPSKIRVKAVKFDDGVVEAYLPELEFKKSRRELLKEAKEKKEPILVKEELEPEEEPGEITGTKDYEVSPTADGEVKIKKKKAPKAKEEKEEKEEKKPEKASEKKKKPSEKKEKIEKPKEKPAKKSKPTEEDKAKPKTTKKTASKKPSGTKKKSE
ncbi:MAG: 50S ribosomal protein L31e [Thermoplasmatales archaeon]|nr:50S ribosomal protein L31e [Thermoplasmatales archaeon]